MACCDGESGHINVFPDELLLNIFKWLPLETLLICENVCKRWNKLAQDSMLWKRVELIYSGKFDQIEISEKNLQMVNTRSEYIYCLKIKNVLNYPAIKSVIEKCQNQCKNLISLEFVTCRFDKEFENDILKWPKLRKLSIKKSVVNYGVFDLSIQFDQFKDLNYLALTGFGLNAHNCHTLLQCKYLTHIFIDNIRDLSKEFLKNLILSKQQVLQALHIYGGECLDDSVLDLLLQCPQLKDLVIFKCDNLSQRGYNTLSYLRQNVLHN